MGLLDYYRQFEGLSEAEANRALRARRAREKAVALERVPTCDLSRTEWPELPDSEVVNAAIFAARGAVNAYPDRHASRVRELLAARHGVEAERIAVGNGVTELLQSAADRLLADGDELLTPWPSYPLYPLMARRSRARPVPVPLAKPGAALDPERLLAAVTARTRLVVICNPNDPTGAHLDSDTLAACLAELPERVHVLLDEAYVQFQDREREDAALRLTDRFARLLAFRTFSKAYGLSGLRCGYVVGGEQAAELMGSLAPVLGVNALSQAAVAHALAVGDTEIGRRRRLVHQQRARLERALHDLPVDAPPSQGNFVWLGASGLSGAELSARLERSGVIVAPGGPLGDEHHVRVALHGVASTDRLLTALADAFG